MTGLRLQGIWTAPGYRTLTLDLVDPATQKVQRVHLSAEDVQRLIFGCADAVRQIGRGEPPIDWDDFPFQIVWPAVTPWAKGTAPAVAEPAHQIEGAHGFPGAPEEQP